jgi:hypothetical protein
MNKPLNKENPMMKIENFKSVLYKASWVDSFVAFFNAMATKLVASRTYFAG